jgi:hypothetical protein
MPALHRWSHDEWKHEDEKRFQRSLGLSVLLHAMLLLAWKLPPPVWKAADHAVLTVILRGVAPMAHSADAASEKKPDQSLLVKKEPAPVAIPLPATVTATMQVPSPVPAVRPPAALPGSPGRLAPKAAPGRLSAAAPAPVGVPVLLVIGSDGRANQIYWNTLPALTDEQLRRVEAAIRLKTYAPGQTVQEVFDVRGFFGLPPARTEQSLTPPATSDAE